ncbi:MAG: hypothetical protein KJ649_07560 [Proteobacteria bacterium]|nr:hypothetical protein [Pseudomonadota bacterium]MBU1744731.1 hypothetical protein [Pseudomonadota bacterium]MBU1964325.1 hypothetical protein [Pseudomonadota bacterium]
MKSFAITSPEVNEIIPVNGEWLEQTFFDLKSQHIFRLILRYCGKITLRRESGPHEAGPFAERSNRAAQIGQEEATSRTGFSAIPFRRDHAIE